MLLRDHFFSQPEEREFYILGKFTAFHKKMIAFIQVHYQLNFEFKMRLLVLIIIVNLLPVLFFFERLSKILILFFSLELQLNSYCTITSLRLKYTLRGLYRSQRVKYF